MITLKLSRTEAAMLIGALRTYYTIIKKHPHYQGATAVSKKINKLIGTLTTLVDEDVQNANKLVN